MWAAPLQVPPLTGARRLVVKFRPSKKALGKTAEGPGADALAAVRASMSAQEEGATQAGNTGEAGVGCAGVWFR